MWPFKRNKGIEEKVADLIKSKDPDFSNLFNSISNRDEALAIYKELSRLLHPDRFIDTNQAISGKAAELFKELQACKTDLVKLHELKEKASVFLNQIA